MGGRSGPHPSLTSAHALHQVLMNNLRLNTAEYSPSHCRHATVGPTGDTQNMHESGRLRLHPPPVTTGPAHAASDAVSARRARATCQSVARSALDGAASSWAKSAAATRIQMRSRRTFCAERRGCRSRRSSNARFHPRPDISRAAHPQQRVARRDERQKYTKATILRTSSET